MSIETSEAELVVNVVDPVMPPLAALTVADPTPLAVAKPLLVEALLIVTIDGFVEDHVTCEVRSCVVPSEYVPVALICCVEPSATDGFGGVTVIELKVAELTVKGRNPETPFNVAETVADPIPFAVTVPCAPETLLTDATIEFDETQFAKAVTS
jgi:hypothetical protein